MIDKQDHNSFMRSFGIVSLFTNVPLEKITEIVIKNVFDRKRKISARNHMFKREIWDKFTEFTFLKF